jgi:hypothetical protein
MRRSFLRPIGMGLALLVVGLFLGARAQNLRPAGQRDAIDVVRVINTAEYDYRLEHGRSLFGPSYTPPV